MAYLKFWMYMATALMFMPHAQSYRQNEETLKKLKQLKISSLPLGDLYNSAVMVPAPIKQPTFDTPKTVHFWMISCTGCIQDMKKEWKTKDQVWINLDENLNSIRYAQDFLKKEKIEIIPYHDTTGAFRHQIGRKFTLPIKLKVHKDKVQNIL